MAAALWHRADQRRLGADLRHLGYNMTVVSDALEAAARPRLSASTEAQREGVIQWLGTPEGSQAYRAAERYRAALIGCAATHDRAALVAAAQALGEQRSQPSRWSARTLEAVIVAVRIVEMARVAA